MNVYVCVCARPHRKYRDYVTVYYEFSVVDATTCVYTQCWGVRIAFKDTRAVNSSKAVATHLSIAHIQHVMTDGQFKVIPNPEKGTPLYALRPIKSMETPTFAYRNRLPFISNPSNMPIRFIILNV